MSDKKISKPAVSAETSSSADNNILASTKFRLRNPATALGLLICFFVFFLIVASVFLQFIPRIVSKPEAIIRISAVIQDLMIFILPAIATAMIVTRLPARLLRIDCRPHLKTILLAFAVMIVSIPAMNLIISWNQNWQLPESMAAADTFFRTLEQQAQATTDLLIKGATLPSLIVSVLIVGVLAGFSEEFFFRGALQNILSYTRVNIHVVIWLVAFIFSAFHFQLFGLVPRMLLGAFFGYLLVWSRSLWVPVLAHVFNNTVVVVAEYFNANSATPTDTSIDTFGSTLSTPVEIAVVIASILLTVYGIILLRRHTLSLK